MKVAGPILLAIALSAPVYVAAENDRATKQQTLDAACEVARERKLEPERAMYAQECVQQKMKDTLEERQLPRVPHFAPLQLAQFNTAPFGFLRRVLP